MKGILCILLNLLFLCSCKDELNNIHSDENEFEAGKVILGINKDVSIDRVFKIINREGLSIDQMSGFFNYSTLPNDSLDYVINYLKDKSYLTRRGFTGGSAFISRTEKSITVTEFLFNMDQDAQADWLKSIITLKLEDLGNDTQSVAVIVEDGTEKFWASEFNNIPEVKWAELNWFANIELH